MRRFGCCGDRDRPSRNGYALGPSTLAADRSTLRAVRPFALSRLQPRERFAPHGGERQDPYGCAGPRPDGKQVVLFPSPVQWRRERQSEYVIGAVVPR